MERFYEQGLKGTSTLLILEITSFASPFWPFNMPSKVKCVSFKLDATLHASVPNSYITVCSKIGESGFLIHLNKSLWILNQ